ncbi:hypothetical protein F8M41_025942 [Gigaspora margarita]|uniref:Uncharacterized protein n=1 Tax=Gigaspora margarita TaxID=4874 RepID=A0A8H4AZV7_GIGMA|nr:hypothetical protein F8M41_025942 [Gigaspora margarita]
MKTLPYNGIFIFIASFLFAIFPTGLTANAINYAEFTYNETFSQSNLTGQQPKILAIRHYQDSADTAVIRISRVNYYDNVNKHFCYEQSLLLRVIQGNGTVIKINVSNIEEIQDINYCNNGFLRLSAVGTNDFEWRQYAYNDNVSLRILQDDTTHAETFTSFKITVFATLSDGYAIVYVNTTDRSTTSNTLSDQFTANAGLYAIILGYNQTNTSQSIILHEMHTPNNDISFNAIYCSIDYIYVGHTCILAGMSMNASFFLKVRFLSAGSVLKLDPILNMTSDSAVNIMTLPLGGYALTSKSRINDQVVNVSFVLYDENNQKLKPEFQIQPINSNFVGAFDILRNNTIVVALNEISSSWRLLSIYLPKFASYGDGDYGNLHVNTTYPQRGINNLALNTKEINITFNDHISLSYSNAALKIYQKINQTDILRQSIDSSTCSKKCTVSGYTIILDVFKCTFNDPGGQYYIQMDNDFVKSSEYNEPIPGIYSNKWTFQTENTTPPISMVEGDILGRVRLTTNGSQYFNELDRSKKHDFFTNLIKELALTIPTEEKRLKSNEYFQFDTSSSSKSNILISLSIVAAKIGSGDKKYATEIKNDLDQLITNKIYTNISTGVTTQYLDENYGFEPSASVAEFFEKHKIKISIWSVTVFIFLAAFLVAKWKSPKSENFAIFQLGIAMIHFGTLIAFNFTEAKGIQSLFIPSSRRIQFNSSILYPIYGER